MSNIRKDAQRRLNLVKQRIADESQFKYAVNPDRQVRSEEELRRIRVRQLTEIDWSGVRIGNLITDEIWQQHGKLFMDSRKVYIGYKRPWWSTKRVSRYENEQFENAYLILGSIKTQAGFSVVCLMADNTIRLCKARQHNPLPISRAFRQQGLKELVAFLDGITEVPGHLWS